MTTARANGAVGLEADVIGKAPAGSHARDRAFKALLISLTSVGLVVLAVLVVTTFVDGAPSLSVSFLTSFPSAFPAKAGIESAITGTLWLMVIVGAVIIPLGIATALYLEEYANADRWWNRVIEVNIQNLAAVPSIVYGILGLAYFVRGPLSLGRTVLAGGLTLSLVVLPVVIITTREAIRAVPPSIKEGALALGSTRWQAVWRQILPASIPGIATGVILSVSRAIGETAPLILVGAATFVAFNPTGLDSPFTALPLQIFSWTSQPNEDFKALAAAAIIVLLVILAILNGVAIWLRNRYQRKW
ncbi:MAG: phosphate ABC transporter permease PstA [Acidobacteria bacterium]|nr:phosphate ABC transporter permease PstA [Acidobacteriota bacterium]